MTGSMHASALSHALKKALLNVMQQMGDQQRHCLIGGSCGLLLQGVSLETPPRDLDIYVDAIHRIPIYEKLAPLATDQPEWNVTEMYQSYLSHYELEEITIELVAGFKVSKGDSCYQVDIDSCLMQVREEVYVDQTLIPLMPLAHEFVFNILRDRADRYTSIAETMKARPDKHASVLNTILSRNQWSELHMRTMRSCLQPDFQL
ncbi:hypothetical protein [Marinicrinis sediminis]|uniref:Nucleotidyl transferase AbiEii/AbiGii toxin family protein n=1 Tax=Marinicrinis sediminis TaxID=1652465 RepID=A0ABW5RER6_9BACL